MKSVCKLGVLFSVVLFLALIAGCSKEKAPAAASGESAAANTEISGTLRVYQSQPEYQTAMLTLINAFKASHPSINTEWVSSPVNITEAIAAGELPDIFYTVGYNVMGQYIDHIRDVSDQSWVNNLNTSALPALTYQGKPYGMPITVSGLGVIYNKKMFAENGWKVPTTKTEFIALCETIQKAGITPLTNEFGDNWYLGNHFLGIIVGNIKDTDDFLRRLYSGETKFSDNKDMYDSFDVLETMLKYGQRDSMAYFWNETASAFALGESAMFMGGDWYWETLYALDPEIDCGLFPFPIQEDPAAAKLVSDVNFIWHVAKESKNQPAALEFLNWMAADPEAKRIQIEEMRIVPSFKGWVFNADSKLAASTSEYYSKGMVYNWYWPRMPSGFPEEAGSIYQKYIGKELTREQALKEMDNQWEILAN
jgi:raffinose/stachyose/melibiose transport system substrate-binding protein